MVIFLTQQQSLLRWAPLLLYHTENTLQSDTQVSHLYFNQILCLYFVSFMFQICDELNKPTLLSIQCWDGPRGQWECIVSGVAGRMFQVSIDAGVENGQVKYLMLGRGGVCGSVWGSLLLEGMYIGLCLWKKSSYQNIYFLIQSNMLISHQDV